MPSPSLAQRPSSSTPDLSGLWIPLVTPFHNGAIDHNALHTLTAHMKLAGVTGFCACGSTGEAAALSHEEEDAVLATILNAAGGLPVIMGASDCHMGRMLERVEQLNAQPLAALLVPPPSYIRPSQAGLLQWFTRIADASTHPIVIYDIPYRTGATLELATLLTLAAHPNIVAIKDCGGDASKTLALINDGQLQVLAGEDLQIFSSMSLGGKGAIAASAHGHTEQYVALVSLLAAARVDEARALWYPLLPHIHASFEEPNPAPIKAYLARQGWMRSEMRAPMIEASDGLVERMSRIQMPELPELRELRELRAVA